MINALLDLFDDKLNLVWLLLALSAIWCSMEGLIP